MKKLALSVLALALVAGSAFGQGRLIKSDKDVPDESKVPQSRMDQHEAFVNGEYIYPAKPRNMWALGLEGGYAQVSGDVNPDFGWNAGINFRKALGYALSLRLGALYIKPEGLDFDRSLSAIGAAKRDRTGRLNGDLGPNQIALYQHGFESEMIMPFAEIVLNMNNINFHREQNRWNFNVSGGPAALFWDTKTQFNNVRDIQGAPLGIANQTHDLGNSDDTREDGFIGDFTVIPAATFSASLSYRASDRFALTLQPRYTRTWDDWLDGEAYDDTDQLTGVNPDYSPDKDQLFKANLLLEFALGNKDRRVQPLWWENPLNLNERYKDEYELELNDCYSKDADGDGVSDCTDKEPNSPCTFVDGSGTVIDSDKDGIADCVDVCPFTPAEYRDEVNEDGCADIPDPDYCEYIKDCDCCNKPAPQPPVDPCANLTYPSVSFAAGSGRIRADQNATIQSIASKLAANPACRIVVEGFATGKRKYAQQMAWKRAKAVADALVDTYGISRDRIIVRYSGVDGFGDIVTVRTARTGEYGSGDPAAPFPGTN